MLRQVGTDVVGAYEISGVAMNNWQVRSCWSSLRGFITRLRWTPDKHSTSSLEKNLREGTSVAHPEWQRQNSVPKTTGNTEIGTQRNKPRSSEIHPHDSIM